MAIPSTYKKSETATDMVVTRMFYTADGCESPETKLSREFLDRMFAVPNRHERRKAKSLNQRGGRGR